MIECKPLSPAVQLVHDSLLNTWAQSPSRLSLGGLAHTSIAELRELVCHWQTVSNGLHHLLCQRQDELQRQANRQLDKKHAEWVRAELAERVHSSLSMDTARLVADYALDRYCQVHGRVYTAQQVIHALDDYLNQGDSPDLYDEYVFLRFLHEHCEPCSDWLGRLNEAQERCLSAVLYKFE